VKNRRVIIAIVVLVVVAIAVAGVYFFTRSQGTSGVKTAKVESQQLSVTVTASGKISADKKADIFPPTQGTLATIDVKDGQVVKAGQTLAVLDEDPLVIQADTAKAGIAAADAQEAAANDQMPTRADKSAANAQVASTAYAYNLANSAYNTLNDAYQEATGTAQRALKPKVEQAKLSKLNAYAAYRGAVASRTKLSKTSALSAQKEAAQASAEQAYASLNYSNSLIEKSDMKSPIDGYVVFNTLGVSTGQSDAPKAGPGAAVSPAAAPFTVYQLNQTYFAAEVDETDIAKVKTGQGASVTLDAFPGDTFDSKVSRISPLAILTTSGGTAFPVYLPLSGASQAIRIGMQGNADLKISSIENALVIPIEALFDEGGKSYVYVVQSTNVLKKTEVTVGTITDTQAQIKSGVKEGETVALSGTVKLTDGMTIQPQ
jgi:HlyD family secretion protein